MSRVDLVKALLYNFYIMKKIKTGVIGVGKLGSLHAKIYYKNTEVDLVGVYDTNERRCKEISNLYNTIAFPNPQELIKKADAISIAVPTTSHFEIAQYCLKKNIHILIEKPITANIEEAENLINLAKKSKSVIQVGHIERFNAAVQAICKMDKQPLFIECHRLGPYTPRGTDVSVTMDLMIHDINIISELVKSKIKKIDAVGTKILSDKNDIVNARITFTDNTVANLTSSRVSKESTRKIRIFQKEAYISLDYVKQKAMVYKKENNKIIKKELPVQKEEPLKAELQSFINCIKKDKTPVVSINDATHALKIALKIEEIIESNKPKSL